MLESQHQIPTTELKVPEGVLGGHPLTHDFCEIMATSDWKRVPFVVDKMFNGPVTSFEYDDKKPHMLRQKQILGTTLMVEPFAVKVAVAEAEISPEKINRILLELAKLINADLNIKFVRESLSKIHKLVSEIGAGINAVSQSAYPHLGTGDLPVTMAQGIYKGLEKDLPEAITAQVENHNFGTHIYIEHQTQTEAVFELLHRLNVQSLWSLAFKRDQSRLLITMEKSLKKNAEDGGDRNATLLF